MGSYLLTSCLKLRASTFKRWGVCHLQSLGASTRSDCRHPGGGWTVRGLGNGGWKSAVRGARTSWTAWNQGRVEEKMWRLAIAVAGVLALAGCGAAGAGRDARAPAPTTSSPGIPAQAVAAALAFAAHSDPEVAVVDGYASLPLAVQRGEQPIDVAGGHANPCARPPGKGFTSSERAAIQAAFHGRTVTFVRDPAVALRQRPPGSLLLVATRPLLAGRRGTVMVLSCVPDPQQVLVTVQWDGHTWRATATGAGKR
jgi:hypothetical protein